MTLVTPFGLTLLIFAVAAVTALILGITFSHLLDRYAASHKVSAAAEFIYTALVVVFLAISAYALFFFYF